MYLDKDIWQVKQHNSNTFKILEACQADKLKWIGYALASIMFIIWSLAVHLFWTHAISNPLLKRLQYLTVYLYCVLELLKQSMPQKLTKAVQKWIPEQLFHYIICQYFGTAHNSLKAGH